MRLMAHVMVGGESPDCRRQLALPLPGASPLLPARALVSRWSALMPVSLCRRADAGKPITVVTLGGAVAQGQGASDAGATSYPARLFQFINATFPHRHGSLLAWVRPRLGLLGCPGTAAGGGWRAGWRGDRARQQGTPRGTLHGGGLAALPGGP